MRLVTISKDMAVLKQGKNKYSGMGSAFVFEHIKAFFAVVDWLFQYFKPFTGSVKYLVRIFLMSLVIILAVNA